MLTSAEFHSELPPSMSDEELARRVDEYRKIYAPHKYTNKPKNKKDKMVEIDSAADTIREI